MSEISQEEYAKIKAQAKEITEGVMKVFMDNRWDKRACVMATTKIAAGPAPCNPPVHDVLQGRR